MVWNITKIGLYYEKNTVVPDVKREVGKDDVETINITNDYVQIWRNNDKEIELFPIGNIYKIDVKKA